MEPVPSWGPYFDDGARPDRPAEEDRRGVCPACGSDLVSRLYYECDRGFLHTWECWSPLCNYRMVL